VEGKKGGKGRKKVKVALLNLQKTKQEKGGGKPR